jgi:hypothetical protein
MTTMLILLALLLASAVVFAWVRLFLWQRGAPEGLRSKGWRFALLLALQPLCAGLLYLTLAPPALTLATAGELIVATRGASSLAIREGGQRVVTLPEAPRVAGAERAPDLATALRRHPEARRLRVIGSGLEARDIGAARGRAIAFDPPRLPRGLVELAAPDRVAPGAEFRVGGRVEDAAGGTAELLDPGGRKLDQMLLPASGRFALTGAARVPGVAQFTVRVRDARRGIVDEAEVPLWTADRQATRILLLAGAPSPEIKYLRRWASDAGLEVAERIALGANIALGEPVPPLSAATLAKTDLVIVDERSWAALSGGERGALAQARLNGLGILLRLSGPLPESTRAGWRSLGLPLSVGPAAGVVRIKPRDGTEPPELTRHMVTVEAGDAVPMLRDADGAMLASWRAVGNGRVGIWALSDSFGLVPSGYGDLYGELWSTAIATLARPEARWAPRIGTEGLLPREGQRIALCELTPRARVMAPDGRETGLSFDPASGARCAGYWPSRSGWHLVRDGDNSQPFFVAAATAMTGVQAAERRAATLRLAGEGVEDVAAGTTMPVRRGSSWPWFFAFLIVACGLAWFERARLGRTIAAQR